MVYPIVFFFSTSFAYFAQKAKGRDAVFFHSAICILLPAIMGGLRKVGVGIDTGTYGLPAFLSASNASSFASYFGKEIGWDAVTYFSTKIFHSVNWNFFFYQLIMLTCTYIALYKHRRHAPLFFLWLIFLLGTYYTTYNVMRQSIAASIIFLGLDTLEAKRYGKFLVYVALATTFHSSAVIVISYFIIFHMLLTWKTNRTLLKKAMIGSMFLLLAAFRPMVGVLARSVSLLSKYGMYQNDVYSLAQNLGLNIMLFGELFACLLYYNGMKRLFARGEMHKFFVFNLVFQLAYTFLVQLMYIRVFYYFSFINVMLIASVPFLIKEKTLRNLAFVSVFFVSAVFFYMVTVVRNTAGSWPYESIL